MDVPQQIVSCLRKIPETVSTTLIQSAASYAKFRIFLIVDGTVTGSRPCRRGAVAGLITHDLRMHRAGVTVFVCGAEIVSGSRAMPHLDTIPHDPDARREAWTTVWGCDRSGK